jgi:hypothetical protein
MVRWRWGEAFHNIRQEEGDMERLAKAAVLVAVGVGLSCAPVVQAAAGNGMAWSDRDRDREYGDLRGLLDRTQSDLRDASGLEHGNKQRDRYHNAQDNLSKLDRKLTKGKFDKGALNHSIDDLKSILDHNTLQPSGRDALMRDLTDLKMARDRRY